jgi:hypothetical protein
MGSAAIILPDLLPYLIAILALLVVWQYHQMQVMKGQILAIDVFDRSGIRMYLYVVPNDKNTCEVCCEANGRVFLPSEVTKMHFTPLRGQCANPGKCVGLLVGIYGAWPEARQLLERLRTAKKKTPLQLSAPELEALIRGPWERSISAATDRISVHMLEAIYYEETKPETSITNYRYLLDQAREVRHLPLVVPSYFRLTELLARLGRTQEALDVIEQFESRYKGKKPGPHFPTETQRGLMSLKKSRLNVTLRQAS